MTKVVVGRTDITADEDLTYAQLYYLKRVLNPDKLPDGKVSLPTKVELDNLHGLDVNENILTPSRVDKVPQPSGLNIDPLHLAGLTRHTVAVSNVPPLFRPLFDPDVNEAIIAECMRQHWTSVGCQYRCVEFLSRFRQASLVCAKMLSAHNVVDRLFTRALMARQSRGDWLQLIDWSEFKEEEYVCAATHANMKLMYRLAIFILSSGTVVNT